MNNKKDFQRTSRAKYVRTPTEPKLLRSEVEMGSFFRAASTGRAESERFSACSSRKSCKASAVIPSEALFFCFSPCVVMRTLEGDWGFRLSSSSVCYATRVEQNNRKQTPRTHSRGSVFCLLPFLRGRACCQHGPQPTTAFAALACFDMPTTNHTSSRGSSLGWLSREHTPVSKGKRNTASRKTGIDRPAKQGNAWAPNRRLPA